MNLCSTAVCQGIGTSWDVWPNSAASAVHAQLYVHLMYVHLHRECHAIRRDYDWLAIGFFIYLFWCSWLFVKFMFLYHSLCIDCWNLAEYLFHWILHCYLCIMQYYSISRPCCWKSTCVKYSSKMYKRKGTLIIYKYTGAICGSFSPPAE